MQLSFRWLGAEDTITLEHISQIPGMRAVAATVQHIPVGDVWGIGSILNLRKQIEDAGMAFDVIESIPVHEHIKLGRADRNQYIENFCENIRRAAAAGIKCICYDFMPLYEWEAHYTREEQKKLMNEYRSVGEKGLWENLCYFIERMIPVAVECNVNMAIHPDDIYWKSAGVPHILSDEAHLSRFLKLADVAHNGLTFCIGSLGCTSKQDVAEMAAKYAAMGRIHYVHLGNAEETGLGAKEKAHTSESGFLDMHAILKALYDNGFDGYIRPDRGRMIWGETGKPGTGFYDRALGATYIGGLWEGIIKTR